MVWCFVREKYLLSLSLNFYVCRVYWIGFRLRLWLRLRFRQLINCNSQNAIINSCCKSVKVCICRKSLCKRPSKLRVFCLVSNINCDGVFVFINLYVNILSGKTIRKVIYENIWISLLFKWRTKFNKFLYNLFLSLSCSSLQIFFVK